MAEGIKGQTAFGRTIRGYTAAIIKFRFLVALLVIVGAMGIASGGRHLGFTTDYRYFFDNQNPNLVDFERIQNTYSAPDTLMWVLQPGEGLATSPRMLQLIGEMTEAAWQAPYSTRVDSLSNFQHTTAENDDIYVRDLVEDPANATDAETQRVLDIAWSEPALNLRLISEDGRTTAVVATLSLPKEGDAETPEELEETRQAVAAGAAFGRELQAEFRERYPDIRIELTGTVMLSNAFSEAARSDLSTLVPIMILLLAVMIFLLTRSILSVVASLMVVILSAAAALGTAGWLGIPLSPPSASTPTVILTVAVADSIHILVTMLVHMHRGQTRHEALIESMRINWTPIFLTSVTTAIGFASLNFADAQPFRDLGTLAAIGTMYAWFLSVTLLPALAAIFPMKAHSVVDGQSRFWERFGDVVIRLRLPLVIGMTALIVFMTSQLPALRFDDKFVDYFDSRIDFRTASDFAADNLSGIYQINYSMTSADSGGVQDPEYLNDLEAFANWYREQPEVVHVASFTDVIKRVNRSMHQDDESYYRIPDARDEAAQYVLLYEFSLPYGLDLNDQLNVDKSASRFVVTLDDISTDEFTELRARADDWITSNLPDYMYARPAGQFVMFAYIGSSNFDQMRLGTGIALVLISLILVVALRNVRLGVISLIPNMTPPLVAFGIYALFASSVGFWASFVVATALGLIVDATVHFLSKYQRARLEQGADPHDAVRYAFSTVGAPLWVSTVVLVAGFSVLAFSYFKVNAMLGLMVAGTIATALVLDFLLLPALLIYLDRRAPKNAAKSAAAE
jgi:predicted RND superfamily exporter protein